jgi:esterase
MDYAALAFDLSETLDSLNIDKAHLLGHSLGAKAAMRFALDFPERCLSLEVLDMAPKAYGPIFAAIFRALLRLDLSKLKDRAAADEALRPGVPEETTRAFLLTNLGRNQNGGFAWKMNLEGLARAGAAMGEAIASERPYQGPAVFMRGEKSDYILDSDWEGILKLFPKAYLEAIPSAGHWLHADNLKAVAGAIEKFLTKRDF